MGTCGCAMTLAVASTTKKRDTKTFIVLNSIGRGKKKDKYEGNESSFNFFAQKQNKWKRAVQWTEKDRAFSRRIKSCWWVGYPCWWSVCYRRQTIDNNIVDMFFSRKKVVGVHSKICEIVRKTSCYPYSLCKILWTAPFMGQPLRFNCPTSWMWSCRVPQRPPIDEKVSVVHEWDLHAFGIPDSFTLGWIWTTSRYESSQRFWMVW